MKALATNYAYTGIDALRQGCGGAGFILSSGIADIWTDIAPYSTFEGVNVVMTQQSSRFLLKQADKAAKGKKVKEAFFDYLNNMEETLKTKSEATSNAEFSDIDHLELAMSINAISQVNMVR